MKRVLLRAACLAACLMMLTGCALAQDVLRVYADGDTLGEGTARRLVALLEREFPQAAFELDESGKNLRDLVLSDQVPQLAICSPGEARLWAAEGLTLPLHTRIDDQEEIAREVLSVCVQEEKLFMAPLAARHRQMAVNVKMLEKHGMGYMLDEVAHAVWYPMEFQQLLEEFAIEDMPALDVWDVQQDGAAIEALIQAIYCGSLIGEDGSSCEADSKAVQTGVRWLRDLIHGGLIGRQKTRQVALERFIAGETAIFLDWTKETHDEYAQSIKEAGVMMKTRPYPSSSGLPVRSYELTGVSVFDSGDAEKNALALDAAAFLYGDEQVRMILGERMIDEDDSIWLWDLSSLEQGATLRALVHQALQDVMDEDQDIAQALETVKAGMDAAR